MINVLIVDDDAMVAELNYRYVTQLPGFQCSGVASSLQQAKELVLNPEHPIDLILLDVYAAGEDPIPGADSRSLCRSIRQRGQLDPVFVATPAEVPAVLAELLADGDLVLTQGAGNVGALSRTLADLRLNVDAMTQNG